MDRVFFKPVMCVLMLFALGGCSLIGIGMPASPASKTAIDAPDVAASAETDIVESDVAEVVAVPFLTYEWMTGFSGFLSPPIEVRRAAKADCVSEGYQVAVIEVLALHGDVATATYICRGDTE